MNTYGTVVAATLVAEIKDGEWPHFEWRVTLTRDGLAGAGQGGKVTRTLTYSTGLGHVQTKCGKPIPSTRYSVLPCQHSRCHNAGPQPTPPTLYTVLTSLKSDTTNGEAFEGWCDSFGYDTDSRRALDTYLYCQKSEIESRLFFGADWDLIMNDEDYE